MRVLRLLPVCLLVASLAATVAAGVLPPLPEPIGGDGLAAVYQRGVGTSERVTVCSGPTVARIEPQIALSYDGYSGGSPAPGIGHSYWCAAWTGYLRIQIPGEYTINTTSDDGIRVTLAGRTLIDRWNEHGPTRDSATVDLPTGCWPLRVDYFQLTGGVRAFLGWSSLTTPAALVPQDALYSTADKVAQSPACRVADAASALDP